MAQKPALKAATPTLKLPLPIPAAPTTAAGTVDPRDIDLSSLDDDAVAKLLRRLELKDKLKKAVETDDEEMQQKRSQEQMLLNFQAQIQQEALMQAACERMSHTQRSDGVTSLGGQYDSVGQLIVVCGRCSMTYKGVGAATNSDGTHQLPMHLFQRLDQENIGRG